MKGALRSPKGSQLFSHSLRPRPCLLLHSLCRLSLTRKRQLALGPEVHEEPQGPKKFTTWGPKKSNDLDALPCPLYLKPPVLRPVGIFGATSSAKCNLGFASLVFSWGLEPSGKPCLVFLLFKCLATVRVTEGNWGAGHHGK